MDFSSTFVSYSTKCLHIALIDSPDNYKYAFCSVFSGRRSALPKASNINLNVELSHSYIKANSSNRLYFLCQIHSEKGAAKTGPLNLALLIDASGSMSGEGKIREAKEAAKQFVEGLQEDFVSVYSFSDSIREVIPSQIATDKRKITDAIDRIELEGSTALFKAMRKARENLKRAKTSSLTNRLIIITDGCPTSDEPMFGTENEWRDYSEKFALETLEDGISISAIGVGSDYNEGILSTLGAKSGGEFMHIKNASELKAYLQQQLRTLQKIVAENCTLHFVTPSRTEFTVFSHRNVQTDGNDTKIQIGSIEEGTMEVAGEVSVAPRLPGTFRIAKVFLEYDDLATGAKGSNTQAFNAVADSTDQMDLMIKGRNGRVIDRVGTYKNAVEVMQSARTGRPSEITQKLEAFTRVLDPDSKTRKELEHMLMEQQKTGRIDMKELLSKTQKYAEGKQKEGET
jgi:Ca-activated chloride channel family protein